MGEKRLLEVLEKEFFKLWTYPSVYTDEGITKNKIGKELCDALVVFDNKIFIFSEKTIAFNPNIDTEIAWRRWEKSAINKSYDQLVGAMNFIKRHPDRIFLDRECKIKFPIQFDPSRSSIHLISIASGIYSECQRYFNKSKYGSSGSLMTYKVPNLPKQTPFTINIENYNHFFHAFDDITLSLLIEYLGSISDFSDYITKRELFFKNVKYAMLMGEEDLLAIYFDELNNRGFGEIYKKQMEDEEFIRFSEFHWDEFQKSDKYFRIKNQIETANYWNYLTNNISNAICDGNVGENFNAPLEAHESAVRHLASENRVSKSLLGALLMHKKITVASDRRSSIVTQSICNKHTYFVILIYPYEETDGDYEFHREKRLNLMDVYGLVAKFKFPEGKKFVIVSTDNLESPLKSDAVLVLDYSSDLTREQRSLARRLMMEDNILKNVKIKQTSKKTKISDSDIAFIRNY